MSRIVACPYSSVAVWQRDTVTSTATHTGLLWLGSSMEKRFSLGCRSHHVLMGWGGLPAFVPDMLLRRVMLVLNDVWEFAAHLQQ